MLSVELCGSASTFKFENLDDFGVDFGHFCQYRNFLSCLFAGFYKILKVRVPKNSSPTLSLSNRLTGEHKKEFLEPTDSMSDF